MKRKNLIILTAVLCLLLCSCAQERGTATMKLLLKKSDLTSKLISPPSSQSLQITRYRITGAGPDNATIDITTDNSSVVINGLKVGTWQIRAAGLNAQGTELVYGSTEYELSQNSGTATVNLNNLSGNGTLDLTIRWTNTEVEDPRLCVYIQPQGGTEYPLSDLNPDYGTRSVRIQKQLPAGSYIVRGVLTSGEFHVGGFVETVRIISSQTSSPEAPIEISQMSFADSTAYFLLVNRSGTPISGSIAGFDTDGDTYILPADTDSEITYSLSPDFEESDEIKIRWFLDGIAQGSESGLCADNRIVLNTGEGAHRLDAVVSNSLLGSLGSESVTFMACSEAQSGAVTKLSSFSSLVYEQEAGVYRYITLRDDTLITQLPGEKFLVLSPSNGKIIIASAIRNYLKAERIYTSSDFGWIPFSDGVWGDSVLPWVVVSDRSSGTQNLTFLKFDSTANSLSLLPGELGRIEGTFSNGIIPVTLSSVADICFAPSRNQIYVLDTAAKIFGTSSILLSFTADSSGLTYRNGCPLTLFTDATLMAISPSANYIAVGGGTLNSKFLIGSLISNPTNHPASWKTVTFDAASKPSAMEAVADDVFVLSNGNMKFFYEDYAGIEDSEEGIYGRADEHANVLVRSPDGNYLYAIDGASATVYSYLIDFVGEAQLIGTCALGSGGSVTSEIAVNGSYMLVLSKSGGNGTLSLLRVVPQER